MNHKRRRGPDRKISNKNNNIYSVLIIIFQLYYYCVC